MEQSTATLLAAIIGMGILLLLAISGAIYKTGKVVERIDSLDTRIIANRKNTDGRFNGIERRLSNVENALISGRTNPGAD
jgi:hypothetical protein|tara:strand:- start:3669 stop:3908 length:240 start_codon:yes stop_codon:yes gene_type:complete